MERKKAKQAESDFNTGVIDSCERNVLLGDLDDKKKTDDTHQGRLKDDKLNILLLLFLYVLQGIPLGLCFSIPLILQNRHVSYKQQAIFSFAHWPFSVKILWAPIVDSLYWSWAGRRKSWLIPTQYLIGITMIILSRSVPALLGEDGTEPNVFPLMCAFFFMNILAATQDIAVDGWALTMLSRQNVGYASTCNSVGQTAGYFLGNVVFLALESANFCNSYLRQEPRPEGIITLSSFLMFWGYMFFIMTTLVAFLKKEKDQCEEVPSGVFTTYKLLFRVLGLPSIWTVIIMLMTCKIAFGATDGTTGLKLIEAGVPKEHIALIAVPLVPLQIILPIIISRYTAGPRPLTVFLKAYPYRLLLGLVSAVLLWWTSYVKLSSGGFPAHYYVVITTVYILHQMTVYSMFVAIMAFFTKISDPVIGGTYMTLLNTLCNLGGNWPTTVALWWLDILTSKVCDGGSNLSCDTKELAIACEKAGGDCLTTVDGYYIEVAICLLFGVLWLRWGSPAAQRLQQLPQSSWTYS